MTCSLRFQLVLSLVVIGTLGCGGQDKFAKSRPKTYKASGSVKYKDSPVEGATVVFAPTATDGTAASAITKSDGSFSLEAFPPLKGAVPGSYKVSITKKEPAPPAPTGPDAHDQPPPPPPKYLIPEKYSDFEKSDLRADIPEGGRDDLHFELD